MFINMLPHLQPSQVSNPLYLGGGIVSFEPYWDSADIVKTSLKQFCYQQLWVERSKHQGLQEPMLKHILYFRWGQK